MTERKGIGTGWFYSVLGGGLSKDPNTGAITNLRPTNNVERVPLSFDNTAESRMRGDFAIPTLFGGNFDAVFNPRSLFRNAISNAIPGWSFHGGTSNIASPTSRLVDWRDIPSLDNYRTEVGYDPAQPNYALELKGGESITHNQFLVPDWGTLRFNLHVPGLDQAPPILPGQIPHLRVFMTDSESGTEYDLTSRVLFKGEFLNSPRQVERDAGVEIVFRDAPTVPNYRSNRIAYGVEGFETFHLDVPDELRGKSAKLRFQLDRQSQEVYLDDVFFQSSHLLFGNPTEARIEFSPNFTEVENDIRNEIHRDNYLMEKPQYVVSYNDITKNPNWVSWQLNRTWLGLGLDTERTNLFEEDRTLPTQWQGVRGNGDINSGNPSDNPADRTTDGQLYDRGHMAPSRDRGRNAKDNAATFLMTNMLPQNSANNQEPQWWRGLEGFSRDLVENGRELYIIAGGSGTQAEISSPNGFSINVPERLWKVILVLDRPGQSIADVTSNTMAFAIDIPNIDPEQENPQPNSWQDYVISVQDLEDRLQQQISHNSYDFLTNIPTEIQEAIKNRPLAEIRQWLNTV